MFIQNNNLTIRNATPGDSSQLGIWWRDGSVMAHAGFPNGLSITDEEIAESLSKDTDETCRRLIIEADSTPIGEMNYRNIGDSTAEIGIKICNTGQQEKGYGSTLLLMLVDELFYSYEYEKIVLDTNLDNKRAQHVYEKLGFRKVGIRYDCWKNQLGELQSAVDYEMTKENRTKEKKWCHDIIQLDKKQWEGHKLKFRYTSQNYYALEISHTEAGFSGIFTKKPFDAPFEKNPDETDVLFQPWWDDVKAWGVVVNESLVAVIETAVEGWSNRLIVTELWIDENYRRQGIATKLMDIAKKRAKEEKRRVLMLETQSCNEGAIAFYLQYGFKMIGFDTCAYQNNDIKRKEVRINMGLTIED